MGRTGDVVIVGADGLLRSAPSHMGSGQVLATRLDAPVVTAALGGTRGDRADAGARRLGRCCSPRPSRCRWAASAGPSSP